MTKIIHRFFLIALLISPISSIAAEWSGYVAMEYRGFYHDPLDARQHNNYLSASFEPEFHHEWQETNQSITFKPFFRIDHYDTERSHADIRELNWLSVGENWELRIGISKVFWGVTESQHLVDIINQTDGVENIDSEDKLGQPMINLALIEDWGTLNFFVLPGFRERTFPGPEGRLRTTVYVDTSQSLYEASNGKKHTDFALRWSHNVGDWDFGLSQFHGTNRDPILISGNNNLGAQVLIPFYEIIDQSAVDIQAVKGNWLLKLEMISRKGHSDRYTALTTGFEYTWVGIFSSLIDLGLIGEYLYDDRNLQATTPFQNDMTTGMRFTLNDVQSSALLMAFIIDMDDNETMFNLEASRRLGESLKLSIDARSFSNISQDSPIYSLRKDDYVQLEIAWYF